MFLRFSHIKAESGLRAAFFIAFILIAGCNRNSSGWEKFTGNAMGTYYRVDCYLPTGVNRSDLSERIAGQLNGLEKFSSLYRKDSEIVAINGMGVNRKYLLSPTGEYLFTLALRLHEQSKGSYDFTLYPLYDLWGFGVRIKADFTLPDREAIQKALASSGVENLVLEKIPGGTLLSKKRGELNFDLSSIAKGYGVDMVADQLIQSGVVNYFIDIGGEIRFEGKNKEGKPWTVGIENPVKLEDDDPVVYGTFSSEEGAVATSGKGKNFFTIDGRSYSHIIDPKTGRPVVNHLLSVSVTSKVCAEADGWATALLATNRETALELAKENQLSVLLIYEDNGQTKDIRTGLFLKQFVAK